VGGVRGKNEAEVARGVKKRSDNINGKKKRV